MAHTPFEHSFLHAVTSANSGRSIWNAQGERYALGAGNNRNLYPWVFKVRLIAYDSSSGGTVTFLVQDSPDDVTYTTRLTEVLTIPALLKIARGRLFKTSQPCVRVRASAFAGGTTPTASAYGMLGTFGV